MINSEMIQVLLQISDGKMLNDYSIGLLNEDFLYDMKSSLVREGIKEEDIDYTIRKAKYWKVFYEKQKEKAYMVLDSLEKGQCNIDFLEALDYSYMKSTYIYLAYNNGLGLFSDIKKFLEGIIVEYLSNKNKLKIAFMSNSASTWIGDELYNLLNENGQFDVTVWLLTNNNHYSMESMEQEYANGLSFFKEHKIRCSETYDLNKHDFKYANVREAEVPDVCIWLTPWMGLLKYPLFDFPMNTMHIYIPYGFFVADNVNGTFRHEQYNQLVHNIFWKFYVESEISLKMLKTTNSIGGSNGVFTGYPKMDDFFNSDEYCEKWDFLENRIGKAHLKRIIYSPHHTIEQNTNLFFSTFTQNYLFIQQLAKKYKNETVWIFRPHPQLKIKAIRNGLFDNEEEWEKYVDGWNTENCLYYPDGKYVDVFMNSDAMIGDCGSFLMEYQFTHKPLLFLERPEQRFNEAGKVAKNVCYCISGDDWGGIEQFIKEVVIEGKDDMLEDRQKFFKENLDYMSKLGGTAAMNIYQDLCKELIV